MIGDWGRDWKGSLAKRELPIDRVNPIITNVKGLVFREYACPSCGSLVDSEIARTEDGPLFDLPQFYDPELGKNSLDS